MTVMPKHSASRRVPKERPRDVCAGHGISASSLPSMVPLETWQQRRCGSYALARGREFDATSTWGVYRSSGKILLIACLCMIPSATFVNGPNFKFAACSTRPPSSDRTGSRLCSGWCRELACASRQAHCRTGCDAIQSHRWLAPIPASRCCCMCMCPGMRRAQPRTAWQPNRAQRSEAVIDGKSAGRQSRLMGSVLL
jgi:hypothetical protein